MARGDLPPQPVWAGEAVDLISDLPSAADLVGALAAQARGSTGPGGNALTGTAGPGQRSGMGLPGTGVRGCPVTGQPPGAQTSGRTWTHGSPLSNAS